jgi:uncharacterized iron-regulated protein
MRTLRPYRFIPWIPALALCLLAAPLPASAHTLDLRSGGYVSFPDLIRDLASVRLVFIGELHDNAAHHRGQLQVIRALKEAGVPVVVGLEMMRKESQGALDLWTAGRMEEERFRLVFDQNWGMWPYYRDIFLYAREAQVPLLALNLPRGITQQVARNGFASLTPQQSGELPTVRCDVDAAYQEFIRRSLGGHAHNGNSFRNFCEAQMLWDSVMARTLLDFLEKNPGAVVVVLAGSGHAWKYGIPEQIRRLEEVGYRVLLPFVPNRIEPGRISVKEADYLLLGLEEGPLH